MTLRKISVREYMSAKQVLLTPDTAILEAVHLLIEARQTAASVIDEHGNLIGILSEKDCMKIVLRAGYHDEAGGRVSEYMQTNVISVDANASVMELAQMFIEQPYRFYPVIDDAEVVGQVTRRDVLKALETIR